MTKEIIIGIPKEIKAHECRVAATQETVKKNLADTLDRMN